MSLKQIDFTNGIRSENIQYNFEHLQNDINQNRLFTIGYGIADGLEISVDKNNYSIHVDDGYIVDNKGAMMNISGVDYSIDLTSDILQTVYRDHILAGGKITLMDIPYASNGKHILALDDNGYNYKKDISFTSILGTEYSNFEIVSDNSFAFSDISDGTVVSAKYYTAKDIIYTIYINTNYEIQICKSISSTSPSEYQLNDFLYKLGNVFIYTNINGYTVMEYTADMSDRINVYTSSNNELYIGGKKFSDIRHIFSSRPDNPTENDIWYNSELNQNQLYVYKKIDGEYQWAPIGDFAFSMAFTNKFWDPTDEATYHKDILDPTYFIFSAAEQDMYFEPGANALSVIVDNAILHKDQYEELTLSKAISLIRSAPNSNLAKIMVNLGYTENFISSLLYEIDLDGNIINSKPDICIGFSVSAPFIYHFEKDDYTRGPYVEAIASHLYNVPAQTYKIQKTTSFVSEGHFVFNASSYPDSVFTTNHSYKINEHQLEVYVNGLRLVCGPDYIESENSSARTSNSFKIIKILQDGDVISYRINATCYSYDNDFCQNIPKGYYNFIVKKTDADSDLIMLPPEYNVDTIDYLTVYTLSNRNILIRKTEQIPEDIICDYEIIIDNSRSYIKILNSTVVPHNESLYVTGLKFSRYPQ